MHVFEQSQQKLNNTELVKHCANNLDNKQAWQEFLARYEKRIYYTIIRECQKTELNRACFQLEETVRDLVQDVYLKLLENDCKALKKFRGKSENSIYSYLTIIAKNVVRNHIIRMEAQKRPPIALSHDVLNDDHKKIHYKDRFKSTIFDTEQEFTLKMLQEEIDYCLTTILTGKEKARNRLICQLHFYHSYSPGEIAQLFDFGISTKYISNIISDSRQKLIKTWTSAKQHENITC